MSQPELTSPDYWRNTFWKVGQTELPDPVFDVQRADFLPQHEWFIRHLPQQTGLKFLEIGCAPGRYLWYFHTYFGYQVQGIEYVAEAAAATEKALQSIGIPTRVEARDLFEYSVPEGKRFDIVASFGLVEHFADVRIPLERHAQLVVPGGWLLVTVPNLFGMNGWISRVIQPEVFRTHRVLRWGTLKSALNRLPDFDLVAGGYCGRLNLSSSNLLPWLRERIPYVVYDKLEKGHLKALGVGKLMPETPVFSPLIMGLARRRSAARVEGAPPAGQ